MSAAAPDTTRTLVAARQTFGQLFTSGASLYVLSGDVSNPATTGLLRLNTRNGTITGQYTVSSNSEQTCVSPTLGGATSLYAVCMEYTGSVGVEVRP